LYTPFLVYSVLRFSKKNLYLLIKKKKKKKTC
jgi:hypothetical protein